MVRKADSGPFEGDTILDRESDALLIDTTITVAGSPVDILPLSVDGPLSGISVLRSKVNVSGVAAAAGTIALAIVVDDGTNPPTVTPLGGWTTGADIDGRTFEVDQSLPPNPNNPPGGAPIPYTVSLRLTAAGAGADFTINAAGNPTLEVGRHGADLFGAGGTVVDADPNRGPVTTTP